MSTGNMPNPPDQPTNQIPTAGAQTQAQPTPPAAEQQSAPAAPPLPLNQDMARIIEEQIEVIPQRLVYHTQLLNGVSAIGIDPVNARNTILIIANALRNQTPELAEHALIEMGDSQIAQVNDQALPFNYNPQVAGLLEGLLIDTIMKAYKADPARKGQAREMLERIFQSANETMGSRAKAVKLLSMADTPKTVPVPKLLGT